MDGGGRVACLGGTCDAVVKGPPLYTHCTTLCGPATVGIVNGNRNLTSCRQNHPSTRGHFSDDADTSEASSSTPAASPRLHRRSSPWPPGRLSHRGQKFPATAKRSRVRTAASPYPPDLSWWAVKRRQTLISRVHLLVSLTGPASSGSADTSRRCQGCSHPHQHLPDQAAPSFTQPLRRPGDEGLSPPFDFRRLVAHVLFGPINPTEHLHSPTSLVGWQPNQVGARAALMEGICGPTPDQPFMTPANPKDLGLHLSGPNGRALSKRSALAAGSTHKSSDRPTPAASKTRRTTTYIRR